MGYIDIIEVDDMEMREYKIVIKWLILMNSIDNE